MAIGCLANNFKKLKKDQITKEVLPKFFWFVFVQGNFLEPQSGFQSAFLVEFLKRPAMLLKTLFLEAERPI